MTKIKLPVNKVALIILHFLLLLALYFCLHKSGVFSILPDNANILKWDAEWYLSIKSDGYVYLSGQMCNMAFFPLFPVFWRFTFLNNIGIAVVNLAIFVFSLRLLLKYSDLPPLKILLILSVPSFIFFFLPYSESLFFLFGVLVIKGFEDNSRTWTCLGLLGCSLARSVSVIFVPALLIMMVADLYTLSNTTGRRAIFINTVVCCASCIAGVLIVAYMQWENTGTWFYFLKVQQYWSRGQILIPGIPFTTISPRRILQYDSLALLTGMLSIFFGVKYVVEKIKVRSGTPMPKSVFFSILYLAATTLIDMLFTYKIGNQTNIWSLNRHLFCTPFFVWFLIWFWNSCQNKRWDAYLICGIVCLCFGISGIYKYPLPAIYFLCFSVLFLVVKHFPVLEKFGMLIYLLNLFLQAKLFYEFIWGDWVA